jgi:hypothetical protein
LSAFHVEKTRFKIGNLRKRDHGQVKTKSKILPVCSILIHVGLYSLGRRGRN